MTPGMEENTSAATSPASTGYQVDDLIVDLGQQRVTRAGIEIPLPHLSFDLLLTLARAAPDLVSFDELNKRVWPGLVITPETISQRVKLVRDALGDDSHAPRYIGGVRGRGYRMVASVRPLTNRRFSSEGSSLADVNEPIAVEPETSPRDEAIAPSVLSSRRMWWIGRAGALAIAVLALALAYLLADRFWLSRNAANSQSTAATAQQTASAARVARPAINEQSIAVLPFVDMSERKDQEYFSDGLSDELIELLGKTPGLRVIARTSSFYFKGRAEKLETIAEELRVANVLEGSVRKSGNRLRVTAQLIRADTSEHIWSETFDRDLHDVFKGQDEIASAVVTALRVHLLPMQQPAVQDELRTGNLEAYNQYLQGRQSYNQGDVVGYQRAVTAFRAAIALNSRYAAAYADLALAQFWLTSDTPDDVAADIAGFDSALAAAEKAVALAPGLAAGYSARGFLRAVYRFDFAGALADLDKAVALSPGNASVLHRSAVLLAVLGDLPAAITREEKALALDPLSEEICMRLAFFFASNQQLAQARPLYEKALAIAPNSTRARYHLGELDLLENRPEQALAAFRQTGLEAFSLTGQAKAEYSLGHVDVSRRVLEQLIAKYGKSTAHLIAEVYAWRGEKDQAFEWAERAYVQRDIGITWLKIDTDFRSLRGDARYRALLRKMNLPD
jgi:TolB-like protein/DNA-binding winged helix-turn-helix (wHTH) protein/Flp pilus assembly protein TadD